MEANVILCKCNKVRTGFGIRIEKMRDGDWWRTWAFKISEKAAQSEGYDKTRIQGNFYTTEQYLGCPYCGTNGFVQCNVCRKISCWNGEKSLECLWCGNIMDNIATATEKFDVSGGQF